MTKRKARITLMIEYELESVEGMTPELVLQRDLLSYSLYKLVEYAEFDKPGKAVIVRKEIL